MVLEILPTRTTGAAENMATDFLLLQRYPRGAMPRFRHYGWRGPAFTFGYAQKVAFVRSQLPPGETFDLCRRPTGGGVVDHRDDWTYALVIPRGHPLEEVRATQSYRAVHEAIADALRVQDVPVKLQTLEQENPGTEPIESSAQPTASGAGGVCFQRAELFDVVHAASRAKIAGAAQKRNKHGLLVQGSIWRPAAGASLNWNQFEEDFVASLATTLGNAAQPVPWPDFNEDEVTALTEQYASSEWIEYR